MDYATESLKLHEQLRGKIEIVSRAKVDSKEALSLAYTPGVAQPCLEIQKDISKSYELTRRWNTVAVVTDGTAVLGLGRYRSRSRYARDGGQMRALQGVRRRGRHPAVHPQQERG